MLFPKQLQGNTFTAFKPKSTCGFLLGAHLTNLYIIIITILLVRMKFPETSWKTLLAFYIAMVMAPMIVLLQNNRVLL
jgi:Ca2+/Na+ antiporter